MTLKLSPVTHVSNTMCKTLSFATIIAHAKPNGHIYRIAQKRGVGAETILREFGNYVIMYSMEREACMSYLL